MPMYIALRFVLYKRLKILKGPLKQLNKLYFSHISKRVARVEAVLEQHQTILHNDRDNTYLLTRDKQLRLDLVNLKSTEKMFYAQKLNCNFFKEFDRGTNFFHTLMSQKNKRNFISTIQCSNGFITTSVDEVGEVLLDFISSLWVLKRILSPLI
jgi:hypothetical protein